MDQSRGSVAKSFHSVFALQEARAALAMNNMSVMGSTIKVELVGSARKASPQGAPDPFAAMQAHRLAQLQLVRMFEIMHYCLQ